jgi:hypothetical protein
MNGKRVNKILWVSLLLLGTFGYSSSFGQQMPKGVSFETWEWMQKRWNSYQSWVSVELKDGSAAEGQLVLADDQGVILLANRQIPLFPLNEENLKRYEYGNIQKINLIKGGHPYQGLIIGGLTGIIPGAVTGIILAQGWTVIPGIVFGAITGGAGAWIGSAVQKSDRKMTFDLTSGNNQKMLKTMSSAALLETSLPDPQGFKPVDSMDLNDFENQLPLSVKLRRAFPDNPWRISVETGLMTNNVRKKLQNWFLWPLWGPPDGYYETRLILQADLSRRIGNRFEAGLLVNGAPGDISYSYFDKNDPEYGLYYSYVHIFKQANLAMYGGYSLQPTDRFLSHRFQGSVQAGVVLSDIYEHFYFQWAKLDYTDGADKLTQRHFFKPGIFLRARGEYFLIPGLSVDFGVQTFIIDQVLFEQRTVLPVSEYGPQYIPMHKLNFSSIQLTAGFSVHL